MITDSARGRSDAPKRCSLTQVSCQPIDFELLRGEIDERLQRAAQSVSARANEVIE
jgi:hypothetical protein